jgi:hypothetical protein
MPVKRPFLLYLRSRLNLGIATAGAAVIIISGIFLGPWSLGAVLLVIAAYVLTTAILIFSRKGAEEIVEESEQDRKKLVTEKIETHAALRERIAVIRIADEPMRKALEYFLLESGMYIEKCRELALYSPRANKRIEDVLEICQAFLGELDESSIEKRYGVKDGESFEVFRGRSVAAVTEAASDIKSWIAEDLAGVSREDRLSIIEEWEGKK